MSRGFLDDIPCSMGKSTWAKLCVILCKATYLMNLYQVKSKQLTTTRLNCCLLDKSERIGEQGSPLNKTHSLTS